jgi:protein-L-isoaspartate O-methyltransferase
VDWPDVSRRREITFQGSFAFPVWRSIGTRHRLPPAWLDQLADGGRLIAPLHDAAHAGQALVVVDRRGDHVRRSIHEAVHFVPLKSGLG